MKCPVDGTTLMIADRSGVEIDYCPQCRGVWLDRGELDKIIERADTAAHSSPPPAPTREYEDQRRGRSDEYDGRRKKKRSGFGLLEEIFDF